MICQDRKLASSSNSCAGGGDSGRPKKRRRVTTTIQTAATLERRRIAGGVGGLGKGSNPLETFFPFDPYLLRRSYDFVEPHYRHWNSGFRVDDVDDESREKDNESVAVHDDFYDISLAADRGDNDNVSINEYNNFLSDDKSDNHFDDEEEEKEAQKKLKKGRA